MNYYNEIDRGKAAWLRENIRRGLIAPGDVDGGERLDAGGSGAVDGLGDVQSVGRRGWTNHDNGRRGQCSPFDSGATRGAWAGADWVLCRPQRVGDLPSLRPIKSSAQRLADGDTGGMVRGSHSGFPLAQGEEARTLRLKGYGDAIAAPQAAAFIEAVMEEL